MTNLPGSPLVSVIVPAYNAAKTLPATLGSIVAQTYSKIEILVVDDGSTDGSAEIAEAAVCGDRRVRIIRQSNAGTAAARNRGLAAARGELVAPIDADDLWHPAKLARQVRRMGECDASVALVYCWFVDIDEADIVIERRLDLDTFEGNVWAALVMTNFIGNGSVPLIRRHALEAAAGWDESFRPLHAEGCEDWALYLELAQRHAFALEPGFLVGYRQSPGAMSRNTAQMRRSFDRMMARVEDRASGLEQRLPRWSRAAFDIYCASLEWQRGDYVRAIRFGAMSLARDPQWLGRTSTANKLRRAARRGARRLVMPFRPPTIAIVHPPIGRPFAEMDPSVATGQSEGGSVDFRRVFLSNLGRGGV